MVLNWNYQHDIMIEFVYAFDLTNWFDCVTLSFSQVDQNHHTIDYTENID